MKHRCENCGDQLEVAFSKGEGSKIEVSVLYHACFASQEGLAVRARKIAEDIRSFDKEEGRLEIAQSDMWNVVKCLEEL